MSQTAILLREVEAQQEALERQRNALLALRTMLVNHEAEGPCREHFAAA